MTERVGLGAAVVVVCVVVGAYRIRVVGHCLDRLQRWWCTDQVF